jgi:phosphoribosylformylglycinamidine cyclo-ligase
VLSGECDAVINRRQWETPRIFVEIQRLGGVSDDEMTRVFNLGIGMVIAVRRDEVFRALDVLRAHHHRAVEVGEVVGGSGAVRLVGR